MRIQLEKAFLLHSRPYRESSALLELFTESLGRVAVVARGVRSTGSRLRPYLQLFSPLLVSFQGKSELMSLTAVEPDSAPYHLQGDCLLSGFYLNELLLRLLQKQDPHPDLYSIYRQTLIELQKETLQQKVLRLFEKKLLEEIGYGLALDHQEANQFYRYIPDQGFELVKEAHLKASKNIFSGKSLLALFHETLDDETILLEIKQLMRIVFSHLLGDKPLASRKLFIEV